MRRSSVLYGPISLRRDIKQEAWDRVLPLIDRIERGPPLIKLRSRPGGVHRSRDS